MGEFISTNPAKQQESPHEEHSHILDNQRQRASAYRIEGDLIIRQ
jgi:hypothetical protein